VDAWADDSGDDPLLALMLAIHEALAQKVSVNAASEEIRKKVIVKAKALGGVAAKSILRGGLKFLITEKGVAEFEEVLKSGLDESFDAIIDSNGGPPESLLISRRAQIDEFRLSLGALLREIQQAGGVSLPLIVLVDELDRCRPTYALKLLEESKHFFENTETVFVYGINVSQLTHTVRAVYGSEYNASHYLARFLKVSLNLPVPDTQAFVETLMDTDPHAVSEWRIISGPVDASRRAISRWLSDLFTQGGLTARDIERVMDNLFLATRVKDDSFPVQLAALAPRSMLDYLSRTGRPSESRMRYSVPRVGGVPESENLYDDLTRRSTAAAIHERLGGQSSHIQWIVAYAQDYFNTVNTGAGIDLNEIKLPHQDYADLIKRIGPRTYGDDATAATG
jgi:hypothetical protein